MHICSARLALSENRSALLKLSDLKREDFRVIFGAEDDGGLGPAEDDNPESAEKNALQTLGFAFHSPEGRFFKKAPKKKRGKS